MKFDDLRIFLCVRHPRLSHFQAEKQIFLSQAYDVIWLQNLQEIITTRSKLAEKDQKPHICYFRQRIVSSYGSFIGNMTDWYENALPCPKTISQIFVHLFIHSFIKSVIQLVRQSVSPVGPNWSYLLLFLINRFSQRRC